MQSWIDFYDALGIEKCWDLPEEFDVKKHRLVAKDGKLTLENLNNCNSSFSFISNQPSLFLNVKIEEPFM